MHTITLTLLNTIFTTSPNATPANPPISSPVSCWQLGSYATFHSTVVRDREGTTSNWIRSQNHNSERNQSFTSHRCQVTEWLPGQEEKAAVAKSNWRNTLILISRTLPRYHNIMPFIPHQLSTSEGGIQTTKDSVEEIANITTFPK